MTVCIGAICQWDGQPMIVGASDRMLTAGDIEFQPPQQKVWLLGTHCVALMAGDAAVQAAILAGTHESLSLSPRSSVKDMAFTYAAHFAEVRRQIAEKKYLVPLGLDWDGFLRRQGEMSPELVHALTSQLQTSGLSAETIIAGVDGTGAHIYVVGDPGQPMDNSTVGFAAVGSGQYHASSQFMFAEYTRHWTFARALFLTYAAKKRAEVAPGVGHSTEMLCITAAVPNVVPLKPGIIEQELYPIYAEMIEKHETAMNEAQRKADEWITASLNKAAQAAADKSTSEQPTQRADQAPQP